MNVTLHQIRFNMQTFYNDVTHTDWDLCVAVTKIVGPLDIPYFGAQQVPSNKLSRTQLKYGKNARCLQQNQLSQARVTYTDPTYH